MKQRLQEVDKSVCFEIADNMEECIIEGNNTAEVIKKLETKMINCYDKVTVVRLLCLLSITQNGLIRTQFNDLRKTFITAYGFDEVLLLNNLQEGKLFSSKDSQNWLW